MSKTVLCACEDVTTDEVRHALSLGFCDIESIKRYTGFGTGMCQGKQCLATMAAYIQKEAKPQLRAEQILPFTPRPPLVPTALKQLASLFEHMPVPAAAGTPPNLEDSFGEHALASPTPIPKRAATVIIGGGIMGLGLAHNLAKLGAPDIVVLEKGYLCAGASGRNGGGVRMQWGTQTNIELAKRSIELMKKFAREMGINIWLRQGGYLFLAKSERVAAQLERNISLHNKTGVHTQLLTPDAARDIVPELNLTGVLSAAFNKEDGVIFPWPFMWGYAQAAIRHGAQVETFTTVKGIEVHNGLVRKLKTNRGDIECERVIVAAGAWSPQVARLANVVLPNTPQRHEICSTEPLKPFLQPLVSVLDTGLYFSQSMRGELVGGMGDHDEFPGMNLGSSARFLARYAEALNTLMPQTKNIKVLRQWAGAYDVTPDNSPILGKTPGLDNMIQMSGFVGHGFMMAPAVAERMANWLAKGESDELFEKYSLRRFAEGRLEKEDMIIG